MKRNNYFYALVFYALLLSCATQTTPMGGPKDVKAPILQSSTPNHNQKNFKGKTVELNFNETVVLKNEKEQIIITPSPGKDVEMKTKGPTVTITPKAGWQDSTTYSINFREAVQDITEGNPVLDLKLAFSTGPIIDSLSIVGSVYNALSEKIPESITVGLYAEDTFNIFKHVPRYFTKSNKKGEFQLDNLKQGTFYTYAFDDKNKNLKVDGQNESFAFLAAPIKLSTNVTNIKLPLVKLDTRILKVTSSRSVADLATIKLSKAVTQYNLRAINNESTPPNSFGTNQAEIYVYLPKALKDSLQFKLSAQDSLQKKIDTVFYVKTKPARRDPEKFNVIFTTPTLQVETGRFQTTFKSTKLISTINLDSIRIQIDSARFIMLETKDFIIDTVFNKGEILKILTPDKTSSPKESKAKLLLGKNYISSIENDTIKASNLPITLLTNETTGTLLLEVKPKTETKYIIQLLTTDNRELQSSTNQKKITFKYLEPSTYKIRVIIDKNGNGMWDTGNIFKREEPEPIFFFQNTDKKYEFPIRANWEVGPYTITF
jgi:uncharacterized protein (DUF2141 family)